MTEAERLNEIGYQLVRIKAIERRLEELPKDSRARAGLEQSRRDAEGQIARLEAEGE